MKALRLTGGKLKLTRDAATPEPAEREVLIDVRLAGVCETDLQLVQGYMKFEGTLGHEFVGVPRSGTFAGQRVAGNINCCPEIRCDACPDNRHHCANRTVLGILARDGAFAETVSLPEENLYAIPDVISDEEAVFVEPLAAAYEILEQTSLAPGTEAVVLGDGRLGYLIAQVLSQSGANVLVVGKHPEKLRRFADRGLSTCFLEEMTDRRMADFVVDCTGSVTGLPTAMQLIRPRGTIVMKTTIAEPYRIDLSQLIVDEIQLLGSRCGPFPRAIEALRNREIEVTSLITGRFPLDEAENALRVAALKDQHKVLISM